MRVLAIDSSGPVSYTHLTISLLFVSVEKTLTSISGELITNLFYNKILNLSLIHISEFLEIFTPIRNLADSRNCNSVVVYRSTTETDWIDLIKSFIISPVSYTHLDVYKRQG